MAGRNEFSSKDDTVAHDLPLAQERTRKRAWEKAHPARRYLISPTLRDEVVALAETLMENVDPVACVLFDYAESCHRRGTLKLEPRLNPQGRKHKLVWEEGDGIPTQFLALSRERPLRIGWEMNGMPRSSWWPRATTCAWRMCWRPFSCTAWMPTATGS